MNKRVTTKTAGPLRLLVGGLLGYGGYMAGNLVFLVAVIPLSALFFFAPRLRTTAMRTVFRGYLRFLTQWYLPILGVYRLREISGRERLPTGAAVYVANHRSRIDAPILLALLPGAATVIKAAYARLPVFSSFVKHLDFVAVDDGSLESIAQALIRCRELIAAGQSILIFPEGTRATSGRLQPFKDLAFRIAAESRVPVVPVVIHTDLPFMAKLPRSIVPWRRFDVTTRILAPLPIETGTRPAEAADRVRRIMTAELTDLDKGTVWGK